MKKAAAVFFSPTGNTSKTLAAMAGAAAGSVEAIDLTRPGNPDGSRRAFSPDDFVFIGTPVYWGRIPSVARERIEGFSGGGARCVVVVTYGNRAIDDALRELFDLAVSRGFVVVGAAAVVGRHTYGEIQVGRPDAGDLAEDAKFAREAASRTEPIGSVPGNFPYRQGGGGGNMKPVTLPSCVKCGMCVFNCPVGAIAKDSVTIADSCLACMRCVRSCPVHAKAMDPASYGPLAKAITAKLAEPRRGNEYW